MDNLIKKSIHCLETNDIIKTAGILKRLKNKLINLFSPSRAQDAEKLIEKSKELKPLLAEIYTLISKIEISIYDLDVDSYDQISKELKNKITELNTKLQTVKETVEKVVEQPSEKTETTIKQEPSKKEEDWKKVKRNRVPLTDPMFVDAAQLYFGASSLAKIGATRQSIVENKIGPKGIYSSWGFVHFAEKGVNPEALVELQKGIKDDDIRRIFYDDIINYKIIKIIPREIAYKDDEKRGWSSGNKKPGLLEIQIKSPIKSLPTPANNWKLVVVFTLVDMYGDPKRTGNYRIYRQLVVYAKDEASGKAEQWSEQKAEQNEQNLVEIKIEEPKEEKTFEDQVSPLDLG